MSSANDRIEKLEQQNQELQNKINQLLAASHGHLKTADEIAAEALAKAAAERLAAAKVQEQTQQETWNRHIEQQRKELAELQNGPRKFCVRIEGPTQCRPVVFKIYPELRNEFEDGGDTTIVRAADAGVALKKFKQFFGILKSDHDIIVEEAA